MSDTPASALPSIGTLWIGGELPFIERLCVSTMVAQGHDVTLYAYGDIRAPAGVRVVDAATIIPSDRVFTYKKTGSYATFADWFRLRMIAETGKVWLDADVALLRPFAPKDPYFFVGGRHRSYGRMVNNYVLHMPADSALCRDALSYFENPGKFLKYMTWHRAARLRLGRAVGGNWDLSQFRWGVFGMGFLTELVGQHGLMGSVAIDAPFVIEGTLDILAKTSPEVVERIAIAHYYSSALKGQSIAHAVPTPGSIHERVVAIAGR